MPKGRIADAMHDIKNIKENFDQPQVNCKKCDNRVVDTGDTLIQCHCGNILVFREPIDAVCCRCFQRTFGPCPCPSDE